MKFPPLIQELAQSVLAGMQGIEPVIHDALLDIDMPLVAAHFLDKENHRNGGGCTVAKVLLGKAPPVNWLRLPRHAAISKEFADWAKKNEP